MKLYAGVSVNVMGILIGLQEFQQVIVDEAYLLTGPGIRNFERTAMYALMIKDKVFKQERIA
jgi:DNA polymerase IV (DinB-like DNA polymerase)